MPSAVSSTRWSTVALALLAHQGGWDEVLFVVGPILLIGGLLRLAKHRVTRADRAGRPDAGQSPEQGGPAQPPPAT